MGVAIGNIILAGALPRLMTPSGAARHLPRKRERRMGERSKGDVLLQRSSTLPDIAALSGL